MPLLSEYALVPDIFYTTSYRHDDDGKFQLQTLKTILLDAGLVRDLRDGAWRYLFMREERSWHRRGKELVKKLIQQRRMREFPPVLTNDPQTDHEWCEEALASHAQEPLTGIVTTKDVACHYKDSPVVTIEGLFTDPWQQKQSPSVRLRRTIEEYLVHLRLILQCANSIMFIDPHIDPSKRRYQDFAALFRAIGKRSPSPSIEVYRVCYHGSGPNRTFISSLDDWQRLFHDAWAVTLRQANLSVEVFILDDFHDRYLISNLIGISMANGFDTTTNPKSITTWTRLGREERDDVQREFDPASNSHSLKFRFKVP